MKKAMIILASLFMVGCGMTEDIGKRCGGDFKSLCRFVFGGNVDEDQQEQIDELKKQIQDLELSIAANMATINSLEASLSVLQGDVMSNTAMISLLQTNLNSVNSILTVLQSDVTANAALIAALQLDLAALQAAINALDLDVDNNSSQVTILQTNLTTLEATINNALVQLAVLNGYQHITGTVNPCGDHPTRYDEVFIKVYQPSTGTYQLVASFSDNANGLNTRFAILPAGGPYVTTDGDSCQFRVAADGHTITNQSHIY